MLNGGLGNQLFGWSTGYATSSRNGFALKLDASGLLERPYELGKLGIEAENLTPEFKFLSRRNFVSGSKRRVGKYMNLFPLVYVEKKFSFDPKVFDLPSGTTLYGYFQSWKYFEDYKAQIKAKILSNFPTSPEYRAFKNIISDDNYVAVHIRRGDYIGREHFHGLTTQEYFAKSLSKLRRESPRTLVCFSDSIEIAKKIMPNCTYYFGPETFNDSVAILRIMSEGKAIIASNSSLSWWAAYLMDDDKQKIFPARWFANTDLDTTDLLPPEWQTII